MSSCTGHVTTETIFGQTLALQLGNGDEHRALESDMTGLNVMGNLYLFMRNRLRPLYFYPSPFHYHHPIASSNPLVQECSILTVLIEQNIAKNPNKSCKASHSIYQKWRSILFTLNSKTAASLLLLCTEIMSRLSNIKC